MRDIIARSNPNLTIDSLALELKEIKRVLLNLDVYFGNGSPEGVVYSNKGGIYLRRDGTSTENVYQKTTDGGNDGWSLLS